MGWTASTSSGTQGKCNELAAPFEYNEKLSTIREFLGYKSPTKYIQFLKHISSRDGTWCLWSQFILKDGLAYVGFYLAIRSGDWDLRMTCLKKMATHFTAFDHLKFKRLDITATS